MLQSNADIGNMDWSQWDKMVLQFNDPNAVPAGWSAEMPNFDFSGLPDFAATGNYDPVTGNTPMLDSWQVNFQ